VQPGTRDRRRSSARIVIDGGAGTTTGLAMEITDPLRGIREKGLEGAPIARREERALVRRAQAGSEEALEALYRSHWGRAHRAAFLIVQDGAAAEDIAQEAFLAAVRALDRFNLRRPFGPWLHRIVVNRSIDWARRRTIGREVSTDDPERMADPPVAPADSGATTAAPGEDLISALAALPIDQRAVIVLRFLLDHTPGEIGRLLGLPRGTVNSRMRRGLDRLRTLLEEEGR
jgi:RNA polymerase sigma-70 factor (ECF subfamily)